MKRIPILIVLALLLAEGGEGAERLPRTVVPEHYALVIVPRIDYRTFLGDAIITVDVREPVSEITLHAADLEIERVHVRDAERRQRAQVSLDDERTTMTVRLRRALVPGRAEIRISYRGRIRDDLRGLYLSRGARDTYLFTQLQPVDARRVFPSFDEPDLKARFDLSVVVDARHGAISNTRAVSTLQGPTQGTRRIRFATTPPISTYMVALAIGPFDCLSGRRTSVPVRFCAQQGREIRGRATLDGAIDFLEYFEGWLGVPYPFDKLDLVAVPDMAAGGMENPGAIFLRENWATVGNDAATETRRWAATLLAHEISHMWVGDLVTMEWWSDVWLNEGLATWLTAKALRARVPELDVDEARSVRRVRALDEDSASRPAIAAPVADESSLFELFDIASTEKPAAMMAMVERLVGEDELRRVLREYLIRYSWGSANTDDFIAHVEAELGGDAAAVIRDYVSRRGFPVVEVSTTCEGGVSRVAFSASGVADGPWHVPVCHRTLGSGAPVSCTLVAGREVVETGEPCERPVLANAGDPGYYRVRYDADDLDRIVTFAAELSAPEKVALLDDEWWLVMEGRGEIGRYLDLAQQGFANEWNPVVVSMIVARLGYVSRQLVNERDRQIFEAWTRSWVAPQLQSVGLRPMKGEERGRERLRRELAWAAGALGKDPDMLDEARRHVRDLLADRGSPDRSLSDVMIHLAAGAGDEALYNACLARARRARDAQDGYRWLMGLTSFAQPDLVRRTIELTTTDVVRAQDAAAVLGRLISNPATAGVAWDAIRDRWGEISKRLPGTFTSDRVVQGAGSFCDEARRREVETFFRSVDAPPRALDAALGRIDRCVAARASQAENLEEWLAAWSREEAASQRR